MICAETSVSLKEPCSQFHPRWSMMTKRKFPRGGRCCQSHWLPLARHLGCARSYFMFLTHDGRQWLTVIFAYRGTESPAWSSTIGRWQVRVQTRTVWLQRHLGCSPRSPRERGMAAGKCQTTMAPDSSPTHCPVQRDDPAVAVSVQLPEPSVSLVPKMMPPPALLCQAYSQ